MKVPPRQPGHDRLAIQEPPQVVGQGAGRRVAAGGGLFQALQADGGLADQIRQARQLGPQLGGRLGGPGQLLLQLRRHLLLLCLLLAAQTISVSA
jgi:hypothetical protein